MVWRVPMVSAKMPAAASSTSAAPGCQRRVAVAAVSVAAESVFISSAPVSLHQQRSAVVQQAMQQHHTRRPER